MGFNVFGTIKMDLATVARYAPARFLLMSGIGPSESRDGLLLTSTVCLGSLELRKSWRNPLCAKATS